MFKTLLVLLSSACCFAQAPIQSSIRGFTPDQAKLQHDREDRAASIASSERIRIHMERMSANPHHAGSPGAKAVAEYALAQLKEWGLDAHIEEFDALLPYPTSRSLEMTAPVRFRAQLKETAIAEDKDTGEPGQLPTFNAYSASGDVSAQLVYVNYGMPEDYEYLKKTGIDVKGKIAIVRYGRGWRGVKAKLAQENGAVGCLIYSDPHEDGYFQNDVYPKGPMRPLEGVQRGSILDMAIYPGDPLTPGWASEPGARRLSRADAKTILKIPVLPISYGDARPLLDALGGPVAPEPWRGALPVTYHLGPGPATVHLKVDFDWTNKPLRDVIVTISGSLYKDQWIVYGNHHDAWVNGASDPLSGASALLETARTLAMLRKEGWQPKRTIVLALWDGEEFGLVGSTEWVEKHEEELERKAAVYINSDSNGKGAINAGGSPSLEGFLKEVLRDVNDPVSGKPLIETPRGRGKSGDRPEFRLGALGAGSDYVAFLDHAGVASLNLGFGGVDSGVYHSIYDTFTWFQRFSDGDFGYGKALSQVMTASVTRLADAAILPYDFADVATTVKRYVEDIQKPVQKNDQKSEHKFEPKSEPRGDQSIDVNLREIRTQLGRLAVVSKAYNEAVGGAMKGFGAPEKNTGASEKSGPDRVTSEKISVEKLAKVNEMIGRAERALLLPDGLPGRPWYRHQIYAPGLYTGYGAKTLPGVREAVEGQRWEEANQQARRAAQALHVMADRVEEATRIIKD
jgi:N-acetylated-alpha-linked acidic dipeptidase